MKARAGNPVVAFSFKKSIALLKFLNPFKIESRLHLAAATPDRLRKPNAVNRRRVFAGLQGASAEVVEVEGCRDYGLETRDEG
jgi:hypothetical protein